MAERTTVRLPEALLKQAKRKAAAEGRSLTALIAEGLSLIVAQPRKAAKPKRLIPRISKAAGGTLPGLELSHTGTLQEMDDLEYVRRIQRFK